MNDCAGSRLVDASLDLMSGSRCAGCGRPGRALCGQCARALAACTPRGCRPDPTPAVLAHPEPLPLVSAGSYDGLLRDLVVAHKEQRRLALARPLGRLLAAAVEVAVDAAIGADGTAAVTGAAGEPAAHRAVVLVPVPSSAQSVRARGHDPLVRMTRVAAARLRRRGIHSTVSPLLAHARPVSDQAGLSAKARVANLEGAFVAVPRHSRNWPGGEVVVVDDVVTTGASLAEAVRALRAVGVAPAAGATVAATQRREPRSAVASRPPGD